MNTEQRDEKIGQEIQLELRWMPLIEPGSVDIAVESGVVTLRGHVADSSARRAVEQLARRVFGVRAVANELQIQQRRADAPQGVSVVHAVVDAFDQATSLPQAGSGRTDPAGRMEVRP